MHPLPAALAPGSHRVNGAAADPGGRSTSAAPVTGGRLAVFADPSVGFALPLAAAALEAAARRPGMEVVALVDAGRSPRPRLAALRRAAGGLVARFDARRGGAPAAPGRRLWPGSGLAGLARYHRVPLVRPPSRDVNRAELAADLCGRLGTELALSVGCRQVFQPPLLAAFDLVANVHDGLLPAHRGLAATSWSLYLGDAESGYSVHRVEVGIDTGAVLLAEALPVRPGETLPELLRRKTRRIAERMDEVLDVLARRSPGTPQTEGGAYRGARELAAVTTIPDPSALPWDELCRRLAAFGAVRLELAGRRWEVTALRPVAAGRRRRLAFTTRDGIAVEPYRFRHLPLSLYRLAELVAPAGSAR
jgi:methionyl-tRNA formyltransferase